MPYSNEEGSRRTTEPHEVGANIRVIRRRRGMTVAGLAAATDLDKAYISRIERGQKAPSLAALLSISGALDAPVAHLLGEAVDDHDVHVVRRGTPGATTTTLQGKRLSATIFNVEGAPVYRDARQCGETIVYALSGAVEVQLPDRIILLESGDGLMLGGFVRHQIQGVGSAPSTIMAIVSLEED